jgi:hypothetical protein
MSELRQLLEDAATRGVPVGADAVYARASRQSSSSRAGDTGTGRRHRAAALVGAGVAAAFAVLLLVPNDPIAPNPSPIHRPRAVAEQDGTTDVTFVNGATGQVLPSQLGIGWVGGAWPL